MMSRFTDPSYLREQQYKTPANLEARIALHRKFGTTQDNWYHWVIRHAALQPGMTLLELGCGPGDLWHESAALIPQIFLLTLGDLSLGMLQQARKAISKPQNPSFSVIDAQILPFHNSTFDLVIANHMLYHVPDIQQALKEIRRVLKPGGRLLAATNGETHMRELNELIHRHYSEYSGMHNMARRFSLENATEILAAVFPYAQAHINKNDLKVTEVLPLVHYIRSQWCASETVANQRILEAIITEVQNEIDSRGYFFIEKSQGLLLAT